MANVTVSTPPTVGRYKHTGREPGAAQATATGTGSTTVTFTKAAGSSTMPNYGICIDRIDVSFATAPSAPTIQISDGTVTWGPHNLTAAAGLVSITFDPPILFNTAAATSIVVTAAEGGSVAKTLSVRGWIDGQQNV